MNPCIKKRGCYFRFRNSINPSGVVSVYWNPISISLAASSAVLTILQ